MRGPRSALLLLLLLGGWGERDLDRPYVGAMPDQPVAVPYAHYGSVMSGTRSFRPVEPLPWASVNRSVAPESQAAPPSTPQPMEGMPGHHHQ